MEASPSENERPPFVKHKISLKPPRAQLHHSSRRAKADASARVSALTARRGRRLAGSSRPASAAGRARRHSEGRPVGGAICSSCTHATRRRQRALTPGCSNSRKVRKGMPPLLVAGQLISVQKKLCKICEPICRSADRSHRPRAAVLPPCLETKRAPLQSKGAWVAADVNNMWV
jgi:hypothetical protein